MRTPSRDGILALRPRLVAAVFAAATLLVPIVTACDPDGITPSPTTSPSSHPQARPIPPGTNVTVPLPVPTPVPKPPIPSPQPQPYLHTCDYPMASDLYMWC
jgi:hypothetical protein